MKTRTAVLSKSAGTRPGRAEEPMPRSSQRRGTIQCEVCGNAYDKPLEIVVNGISHYFDSFECAIHLLAPVCDHCGCKIIGHGVEAGGTMFCCANCASEKGVTSLRDRTES